MGIKSLVRSLISASRKKIVLPLEKPVPEDKMLAGKVALISGGSGGIGMAIAKSFLASGCKVILGGTNQEKLKYCCASLSEDKVDSIILNMYEIDTFHELIIQAEKKFGEIDIFVNSAGIHTPNADIWEMTPEEYDKVMDINLKGVYFFCIQMARYWREKNKKGHVLLISSSRGSEPAWSPYGISKWGINGLTKGLAKKLISYNIIVNAIAPGSTATSLLGVKEGDSIYAEDNKFERLIMPEEIGVYARLLVSDMGDMLTGETIHISGGRGIFDIR